MWRNVSEEWEEQQTQLVSGLSSCSQGRVPWDWVPEQAPRKKLSTLSFEEGEKLGDQVLPTILLSVF